MSDTSTNALLDTLQRDSFAYMWQEANPQNGLVADSTREGSYSSIATTGLALASYLVGVERGYVSRADALQRTLTTLRFFWCSEQASHSEATGYKGFYMHFLDMGRGTRAGRSELSTIDTTFLLAGILVAGVYFDLDTPEEREVRERAEALYRRVDWQWACNKGVTVTHGWKPGQGFIRYRWQGFCEALLLYILALGSPTFALPAESYAAWTETYVWRTIYDQEYLYGGPLFLHQLSHLWVDFLGIQDAFMREKGSDYFENSRRATYAHKAYALDNPKQFHGYTEHCWGLTACIGPGPNSRRVGGKARRFFGYQDRGVPDGPDDGTIAPSAAIASLPFAPEIVLPVLEFFYQMGLGKDSPYGFEDAFNPTFNAGNSGGWVAPWHLGLNQGMAALMIENHRSGFLWNLMRRSPFVVTGLQKAGFQGGWLDKEPRA